MTACLRLDPMTVRAADFAKGDFNHRLGDGFAIADVPMLRVPDVVEVEGNRVSTVSTVNTTHADFVFIQPAANPGSAKVVPSIDPLAVSRLLESSLSPLSSLFRGWGWSWSPRAVLAACRAELSRGSLRQERLAANGTRPFSGNDAFPWRHGSMIPVMFISPCKPDIFEATYEAVHD